jgi:hypothetical protein
MVDQLLLAGFTTEPRQQQHLVHSDIHQHAAADDEAFSWQVGPAGLAGPAASNPPASKHGTD